MLFPKVAKASAIPNVPHHSKIWVGQNWSITHKSSVPDFKITKLRFYEKFTVTNVLPAETVFTSENGTTVVKLEYLKPRISVIRKLFELSDEIEKTETEYVSIENDDNTTVYALVSPDGTRHEFEFTPHTESFWTKLTKHFTQG